MSQGDAAEGLLIILDGTAPAMLRNPHGDDRRIGRFSGGNLVGEVALVTRAARRATVIGDGISAELFEFLQRALRVIPGERPGSLAPLVAWVARCDPPPEDLVNDQMPS